MRKLLFPALAALLCGAAAPPPATPDFSSNNVGWIAVDNELISPPSGPGPVKSDLQHPYYGNYAGRQGNFRVADLSSPVLQPWAVEKLRKSNEIVLSGKQPFIARERCWPSGVPGFLLFPIQPMFFIQTPKEVWMILQYDHQPRRVYLNQPHSAHVRPSWFGESVGHYEGDTLVVDTIGLSERTNVDNYQTPHTEALHVVERFRMIQDGKKLEATIEVEDPGAFTMKWTASQLFDRAEQGPMLEVACTENNGIYFDYDVAPLPQAEKPDF